MDRIVLFSPRQELVRFFMERWVVCYPDYYNYVKPRYEPLLWLMRALRFCELHQIVQYSNPARRYHREFQAALLKYSYAILCDRFHRLPKEDSLNFHIYSEIFRILYERESRQRKFICDQIIATYTKTYSKCYVPAVEKRKAQIKERCSGKSTPFIKVPAFFLRFSQRCNTLEHFVRHSSTPNTNFGKALANDTAFLNLLNVNLITNINQDSKLPSLVLKTRLLLQHFSLAAVKLWGQLEGIIRCRVELEQSKQSAEIDDDETNEEVNSIGIAFQQQCCIYNNNYVCELQPRQQKFRELASQAWRTFYIEFALLIVVFINTILVTILLIRTKKHLSTATVLFIFNILFSNILFLFSFTCLFTDFLEKSPYGPVSEEHNDKSPELIIAETLGTHLFGDHEFAKHLVQETLYSLAQNGSLTGLIHLLVLVLVVINRSMSGKSIHLSKSCVIFVFSSVWVVLIISHIAFSMLQHNAIRNLDELFVILARGRTHHQCNSTMEFVSDYEEIAKHCDRTAVFHKYGAYLLRGHTLFTVLFLSTSIIIFTITVCYHWSVRRQHDIIHLSFRDQSPHQRREMLFHTLLLSIGTFFVSVLGQTYIEMAILWIDHREELASFSKWYQLARLAAFIDPVLNPLIVVIRTPALRRQLRSEWTSIRKSSERSKESYKKTKSHSSEESSTNKLTPIYIRDGANCVRSKRKTESTQFEAASEKRKRSTRRSLESQNTSIV